MHEEFLNLPAFIWENVFTVINTLVCGLIVAIFTSTFLKKWEERTRIAGVILEKRINSEQEILTYLEKELFKEEINIKNSGKYDVEIAEILRKFGIPVPYKRNIQYAVIFKSRDSFEKFFYGYESELQKQKLWLDKSVREHLLYIQMYFSYYNVIPLLIKKIPLPKGKELNDEEFSEISDKVLFLLGVVCDLEINSLISKLDELIVTSVYKLDLKRPRKSFVRNMMVNKDAKKLLKRLENNTIPGVFKENIYMLIMHLVYVKKDIHMDKMTNEEYDEFVKSSDPKIHQEIINEFEEFKFSLENMVKQKGSK